MSPNTRTIYDTIEKLSNEETEYPAPRVVAENAFLKDARAEYDRWKANPDEFWEQQADQFVWTRKWDRVSCSPTARSLFISPIFPAMVSPI